MAETTGGNLSKEQYESLRARIDAFSAWIDEHKRQRVKCRKCKGTKFVGPIRDWNKCQKCEGRGYTLGWASYKQEDLPCHCDGTIEDPADVMCPRHTVITNDERSQVEVYEFIRDKPGRYFAYVKFRGKSCAVHYPIECPPASFCPYKGDRQAAGEDMVTTWAGAPLGRIVWRGPVYETQQYGGYGKRQNLRIEAINGLVYSAVYYKSSGDYCRMKVVSSSKRK